MRDVVVADVRRAAAAHDRVVLLTHRLGPVVGWDLFDLLRDMVDVPLFITAGCPLGLPVVQRHLEPNWNGKGKRPGPAVHRTEVPWLNAYDVRDFVAPCRPRRGPPDRPRAGRGTAAVRAVVRAVVRGQAVRSERRRPVPGVSRSG